MDIVKNPEHWNIQTAPLEILFVKEIASANYYSSVAAAKVRADKAYEIPAHLMGLGKLSAFARIRAVPVESQYFCPIFLP